jgi:hypothetical protein
MTDEGQLGKLILKKNALSHFEKSEAAQIYYSSRGTGAKSFGRTKKAMDHKKSNKKAQFRFRGDFPFIAPSGWPINWPMASPAAAVSSGQLADWTH